MEELNLMEFNSPNVQGRAGSSNNIPEVSPGNNPFDTVSKHAEEDFVKRPETEEDLFNHPIDLQSCGKESLACFWDNDLSARESLGILKLDTLDYSFNDLNVPKVCTTSILEEQKSKEFPNSPLNTAFLHPVSYLQRKRSILSSASSVSTNPSFLFNSRSLEGSEPSRIYSINNTGKYDFIEDDLNIAFLQSCIVSDNSKTCGNEFEINFSPLENAKSKSPGGDIQEADELFNDSVFIEANYVASKIADGSLLIAQSFEENFLDCTSPPSFNNLEENESADVKLDTETVFKVIDKMLLPLQQNFIAKVEDIPSPNDNNSNQSLLQSSNGSSSTEIEPWKNSKHISNNKSICRSISSGSVKSKDANELLQNLSEIINNEYRNSKQKVEGQQLLSSLANILCSDGSSVSSQKYDNLEDSGHSSIEHDEPQNDQEHHACYEVLDLRVVASKSNENEQVLDLSMASKVENTNKRLSQSFSFPRPKLFTKQVDALKTISTSSLNSSKGKSLQEPSKLKPKRVEEKKKGPLKAIIPLGNMSRRKSLSKTQSTSGTPPKVEQAHTSLFKGKKTSTPTAEPRLKPLAQSTPDSNKPNLDRSRPISCSSQLKKRKFYCPVSPLARPSSIGDVSNTNTDLNKSNHSGSAPNLSNSGNVKKNSLRNSNHSGSAPNVSGNLKKIPREPLNHSGSTPNVSGNLKRIPQEPSNHSGSTPNLSGNSKRLSQGMSSIPSPKPIHRRHSATELKIAENKSLNMRRSYSIGKDLKAPGVLNKLKENVCSALSNTASKRSASKVVSGNQKNNILQERNSAIKSFSLLGRFKKSNVGKENV